MKLAFCLFRYFPYGGLQRDFMRIARMCVNNCHEVTVYTMAWQGERPDYLNIKLIPEHYYTNHDNAMKFAELVNQQIKQQPVDLVVGFNKMPGLDIYYCADSCYVVKNSEQKPKFINLLYGFTKRYKNYKYLENAVFNSKSNTKVLFLSNKERDNYQKYYKTDNNHCYLLPPNIDKARFTPILNQETKIKIKKKLAIYLGLDNNLEENLNSDWLLMIGSGFRTKGVDRSIRLLKELINNNFNVNLIVIGQDKPGSYLKLAENLNIQNNIKFLPGRDDIADFMAVSSLLLHPAYRENTGTVILESIIMGLPVVASSVCGYANYISESGCGAVIQEPFSQEDFKEKVIDILINSKNTEQNKLGIKFREVADIYNADEKILDIIEHG